jgi:hypothetical protein
MHYKSKNIKSNNEILPLFLGKKKPHLVKKLRKHSGNSLEREFYCNFSLKKRNVDGSKVPDLRPQAPHNTTQYLTYNFSLPNMSFNDNMMKNEQESYTGELLFSTDGMSYTFGSMKGVFPIENINKIEEEGIKKENSQSLTNGDLDRKEKKGG